MTPEIKQLTLDELSRKAEAAGTKLAVVGLDGFVDKIIHPVAQRLGTGDNFKPFPNIPAFGQRIVDAAGKSTNIEIYPVLEKLGGNGPIMANAMWHEGVKVRYIGALGKSAPLPVFDEFARNTQAITFCDPGITHALEFADGKIMLGMPSNMEGITYAAIIAAVGEGAFMDLLSNASLLALVNWTQIPDMTAIFESLLTKVYPTLDARPRQFFFDIADPAKRSRDELSNAVRTMGRFQNFGQATLGLNLAEGQQVCASLNIEPPTGDPESIKFAASRVRTALDIGCIVIHPTNGAACATRDGAWWVNGPYVEKPLITTGAGDHFNAGFCTAQLLGMPPPACLAVAVSTSGFYVRYAKSPSLADVAALLRTG